MALKLRVIGGPGRDGGRSCWDPACMPEFEREAQEAAIDVPTFLTWLARRGRVVVDGSADEGFVLDFQTDYD